MKNIKILLFGFVLIIPNFIEAQDLPDTLNATITLDDCVTLDTDHDLVNFYKIDIAAFAFESEKLANDHFGFIANNFLTYNVNLNEEIVILQVHSDRTPARYDVVWWNAYLATLCGF
ncbi:hypothetical protein [Crocinitomix catalasitica]|uniref:hypothetical protein n=1 Tax=Crocinitomix catalasitica TaxID=184607 RepID=UPI0004884727|nr:hypothetical protein [Crocinitomix catalasitica]